jgi:hypothetical protein
MDDVMFAYCLPPNEKTRPVGLVEVTVKCKHATARKAGT